MRCGTVRRLHRRLPTVHGDSLCKCFSSVSSFRGSFVIARSRAGQSCEPHTCRIIPKPFTPSLLNQATMVEFELDQMLRHSAAWHEHWRQLRREDGENAPYMEVNEHLKLVRYGGMRRRHTKKNISQAHLEREKTCMYVHTIATPLFTDRGRVGC